MLLVHEPGILLRLGSRVWSRTRLWLWLWFTCWRRVRRQPATAIDDAGELGPHAATNSLAAFRIHEKDPVLFASAFAFQWIASSDNTASSGAVHTSECGYPAIFLVSAAPPHARSAPMWALSTCGDEPESAFPPLTNN